MNNMSSYSPGHGLRQDSAEEDLGIQRRGLPGGNAATACPIVFPIYAIKVVDFLMLRPGELLTHQELVQKGLVREWSMDMGPLAFVSHQWCGWVHPDRNFQQVGVLQTALRRIARVS